jgi:dTDP-4-amino-4,6-dideoxygalactose transaminase
MSTPFLPFALPEIGQTEIDEVVDTLRSGWITTGPKVAAFERAFIDFLGGGEALAVNSATAGLHLVLEGLGLGPGDEVLVPVHTFTATAEVVSYLGATPVFVDVEPTTLTLDSAGAAAAVTGRTRAMLPVHYAGLAADMEPLLATAARHELKVVEDAAHALPATYREHLIGTLASDATVFSFYATKTVATGEGGMVATRSAPLARRIRAMRLHGIDRDVYDRYQGKGAGWRYDVIAPGFKYNLTDIAAALGLHQLARAEIMRARRAAIAAAYDAALKGLPLRLPAHARPGDTHAWHLYTIRLEEPARRDQFIEAMRKRGIGCSVHYRPLHLLSFWRDRYQLRPEDFPISTDAFGRLVSLPIYSKMSQAEVARVIEAVHYALQ